MANSPRKGRNRLVVDVPEHIYKAVKKETVERNCTMTKWIIRAMVEKLKKDSKHY